MPRVEANAKDQGPQGDKQNHVRVCCPHESKPPNHQSWGWLVGTFLPHPSSKPMNKNWMEEDLKITAWICVRLLLSRCKRFYVVKLDYFPKLENVEMDGIVKTMKLPTAILLWFLPRDHWVHGSCKGSTGDSLVRKLCRCPGALGNDANKLCISKTLMHEDSARSRSSAQIQHPPTFSFKHSHVIARHEKTFATSYYIPAIHSAKPFPEHCKRNISESPAITHQKI